MIKQILAKNFKGFPELGSMLGYKTLIVGPNGSGKTALVQALQLAVDGSTPGVLKLNSAIMDAFGGGSDSLYVEVSFASGQQRIKDETVETPTLAGRKFQREKTGNVKQLFFVDRRKADQKAFSAAIAKAPRIIVIDDILALPKHQFIDYLAGAIGDPGAYSKLSGEIDEAKERISLLQKKAEESKSFISRTTQNLASLNLPTGSLAEVQKEISDLEKDLEKARNEYSAAVAAENAEALAKKKAEEDARRRTPPAQQRAMVDGYNPATEEDIPAEPPGKAAEALLESARDVFGGFKKVFGPDVPKPAAAGVLPGMSTIGAAIKSLRSIVDAIQEVNCPVCVKGAAMIVAKAELRKWEGK